MNHRVQLAETLSITQVIRMFIEEFGIEFLTRISQDLKSSYKSLFRLRKARFSYHEFCDLILEW